jgi:IclR family transcriptional regulator, acetate operon repressor
VRSDPATMCWQVGVRAFVVGYAFVRSRGVDSPTVPYMHRLMPKPALR